MSEELGSGTGLTQRVRHLYGVSDPQFRREMSVMLGPSITSGNRVTALHNGDEIFPAMLEAIRGASVSITFETYVYWSGEIGREFAEALSERARAGLPVHIILDWAGSVQMDGDVLTQMEDAGAKVHRYGRSGGSTSPGSTTGPIGRSWWWMAGWALPGASGLPISGRAGLRIPNTGGMSTSASRGPLWRSSRRPSTTIGSRRRVPC